MDIRLLASITALALASSAHATGYQINIEGAGTSWSSTPIPGCDAPGDSCWYGYQDVSWKATIDVTVDGQGDGTYAVGSGLTGLSYFSNLDHFTYAAGDQQETVYPQFGGPTYLTGLRPDASVTIVDGKVTSLDGSFNWLSNTPITFSGLTVNDRNGTVPGYSSGDWWEVSGVGEAGDTAVPAAAPIPEPSTWLMLLVGVGALGMTLRRPRGLLA